MAANDTELNDTEKTTDEIQPMDADLPVDEDAEATNAAVATGIDKKKVAGLGIVVGLVIVAGIAVFSLSKDPASDTFIDEPPMVAQTPSDAPPQVPTKPEAPKPATPEAPETPAMADPNKPVTGALTRPGDANWVKGVKRPLPVPNGLEGTPGLEGSNRPQVRVVSGVVGPSDLDAAPAGSKQATLKRLWNSGAAAKHRGDYAGAKRDWQRMLEISPGHPGIQEAIDKLPK